MRQRDQRNLVDNQIGPPFQENIVAKELEDIEDHIHCFDKGESEFYLTKEYHDKYCQDSNDYYEMSENDDYERGYQNAIL